MRMIFVRHGHPDYKNDCLTDLGRKQAEAAADRLSGEKFQQIYSSSCGRVLQTAECIADLHNLKVTPCDFMREVGWGATDGEPLLHNGHPWHTAEEMVMNGQSILSSNWENEEPFCRNKVVSCGRTAWQRFDSLLAELGYKREGHFYRVCNENNQTYAMVSHGGSSSAVISHIFNIPFPFFCQMVHPDYTSITIVSLCGETGRLIAPRFEILNDAKHIETISSEILFDN